MIGTNLVNAFLSGANLRNAILIGADLRGANLNFTDLSDSNLTYAKLSPRKYDKKQINASNPNVRPYSPTKLFCANLTNSEVVDANLQQAILVESKLKGTRLRRTNLIQSNLTGTVIQEADFSGILGADLHEYSLVGNIGASLESANWYNATIKSSNFDGANLSKVRLSENSTDDDALIKFLHQNGNSTYRAKFTNSFDRGLVHSKPGVDVIADHHLTEKRKLSLCPRYWKQLTHD